MSDGQIACFGIEHPIGSMAKFFSMCVETSRLGQSGSYVR